MNSCFFFCIKAFKSFWSREGVSGWRFGQCEIIYSTGNITRSQAILSENENVHKRENYRDSNLYRSLNSSLYWCFVKQKREGESDLRWGKAIVCVCENTQNNKL